MKKTKQKHIDSIKLISSVKLRKNCEQTIPYETQNQWCVSALQKKAPLSHSPRFHPLLCERVVETELEPHFFFFFLPCISRSITSYFARRLTLNSTQRSSVGVISLGRLAFRPNTQVPLVTCAAVKKKPWWIYRIGLRWSLDFCTALSSNLKHQMPVLDQQWGISCFFSCAIEKWFPTT